MARSIGDASGLCRTSCTASSAFLAASESGSRWTWTERGVSSRASPPGSVGEGYCRSSLPAAALVMLLLSSSACLFSLLISSTTCRASPAYFFASASISRNRLKPIYPTRTATIPRTARKMATAVSHQFIVSALSSRSSRRSSFLRLSKRRWISKSAAVFSVAESLSVGGVSGVGFSRTAGGVGVVRSATLSAANASTTTIVQYHRLKRLPLSEKNKPTTTIPIQITNRLAANIKHRTDGLWAGDHSPRKTPQNSPRGRR